MSAIHFTKADRENLELVRAVVLARLREGKWQNLYDDWDDQNVSNFITFENTPTKNLFFVLMQEVVWQLIIQGVLTPGKDAPNPELPWFRITNYGSRVLQEERFIPHDPSGYLEEVKKVTSRKVGQTSLPYVEEALRCFTSGCNVASIMMLGIAAEAVLLDLCNAMQASLKDPTAKQKFEKLTWVGQKHRWVMDTYDELPNAVKKDKLPGSLRLTLGSLYDLIRKQRNEIGHPTKQPPEIDRERAYVSFRMFPPFIADVRAFANYCKRNEL